MKRLKGIFLFSLLFLGYGAQAQVSERQESVLMTAAITPNLRLVVLDKETESPMEGATVYLSYKKDTLKTVTDQHGTKRFVPHPFKDADTLVLDISYMGYKKIRHKQPMKPVVSLVARMEEDPEQINAIIVKGDKIAMVMHGDTTIYNASAITTMQGARLADLIRKLPGISMSEGGITAYGEKVSKVLINGTMLFESNIAAALDMVFAEEVKKVRVYDEHAQDRLVEKDTLSLKERVMDVVTKRPITKSQELVLLALGGVYVDNNADIGGAIGGVGENWRSFEKNKPSYQVNAGAGHNYQPKSNTGTGIPTDEAYADFRISRNKPFRSKMSHSLSLEGSKSSYESTIMDVYAPTSAFTERTDYNTRSGNRGSIEASYLGSQGFTIRKNSSLDFSLGFNYSRSERLSAEDIRSITDGRDFIVSRRDETLGNRYGANLRIGFSHHFRKDGRKLNAGLEYKGNYGRGNEEMVDTMKTSSSPQWLTVGDDNDRNSVQFNASYEEPLVGKALRLNVSYNIAGDFSKTEKIAFDELLMTRDLLNTQDFTHRDMKNRANVGLRWSVLNNALNVSADASYLRSDQLRNERLPKSYTQPRSYGQISPDLSLRYSKNGISANLRYSEGTKIPSMEQTNGTLDNTSHLYLRAGNPELKASRERNLSASFSMMSMKSGSSFGFNVSLSNTSNSIANKSVYFDTDTYLPEYGYTAAAGSRLTTPVNVAGRTDLSSGCHWSSFINAIKSTLSASIMYGFHRSPFVTGNIVQDNLGHSLGGNLMFISAFSKHVDLMLDTGLSVGREFMDGKMFCDSFNANLGLKLKGNFLKRFYAGTDFRGMIYRASIDELDYDAFNWDVDLTYKLGKKQQAELTLACKDILNKSLNTLLVSLPDRVSTTTNTVFGRSITLAFRYTFR